MRASEWAGVSKQLAGVLDGFEPFRRGFVRRHEWTAECIFADSSNHSRTAFYIEAFVLPLFIPTGHLYFDYGGRVGDRWDAVSDDLLDAVEAALPGLHEIATLDGLLRTAQDPEVDIYHAELHLCVALIRGDKKRFNRMAQQINAWNQTIAWEGPVIDRCCDLMEATRIQGEEAGVRLLRERVPAVLALVA